MSATTVLKQGAELIINEGVELVKIDDGRYEVRVKVNTPIPNPTPPAQTFPVLGIYEIQNLTSAVTDDQIKNWIAATQIQVDRDVAPIWKKTVKLVFLPKGQLPTAGNAQCGFFDNSDTPGAAAWHDVGPNGEPLTKIFVNAAPPSVSFSHEVIETISDWNANTTVPGVDESTPPKPCIYFLEACDAVESSTYEISIVPPGGHDPIAVQVSDFVTPNWFNEVVVPNEEFDFQKITTKPFEVASGGYIQLSYDNGQTWNQVNKNSNRAKLHESPHSRWAIYKKKPEERTKSTFEMKAK